MARGPKKRYVAALATLGVLAVPGTAFAATATNTGGVLTYTAQTGEKNQVSIFRDLNDPATTVRIRDTGTDANNAAVQIQPTNPPACEAVSLNEVRCSGVSSVLAFLGDQADALNASATPTAVGANSQNPRSLTGVPVTVNAGTGNDNVANASGAAGDVGIVGSDAADTLAGEDDDDTISGGDGADAITGGAGADTLAGGNGNDTFEVPTAGRPTPGLGADSYDGGAGTDLVDYSNRTTAVYVSEDGNPNDGDNGGAEGDNVATTIESLNTGSGADIVTLFDRLAGSGNGGTIDTDGGTDLVSFQGRSGTGTNGATGVTITLDGAPGGQTGSQEALSVLNAENLVGTQSNDNLTGNSGDNQIKGLGGNDVVNGAAGNDTLNIGTAVGTLNTTTALVGTSAGDGGTDGADSYIGGPSTGPSANFTIGSGPLGDTLSYRRRAEGVSITQNGAADDGNALRDDDPSDNNVNGNGVVAAAQDNVADDIETIGGTDSNDTIQLGAANNLVFPYLGDDQVRTGDGDDTINDGFSANPGDNAQGGFTGFVNGVPTFAAVAGRQPATGGTGADLIDGQNGTDLVTYEDRTGGNGITVTIGTGANDGIAGEGDNVALGTENVTTDDGQDAVTGSGDANVIKTLDGADTISGLAGNDVITAGNGADTVSGGADDDTIVAADAVNGSSGDNYNGDAGKDAITYAGRNGSVQVTLDDVADDGTVSGDTLEGDNVHSTIEDVTGGNGSDELSGGLGANTINGGPGNDRIDVRNTAGDSAIDTVDCGAGGSDSASTDGAPIADSTTGCENVTVDGTGQVGPTGPAGQTGATGQNGADGSTGATGPAGADGTNGSDGATGPAGTAGTNGTNGTNGTAGAQGPAGSAGPAGPTGPNGAQGLPGLAGSQGAQGAQGAQGPRGATGLTGRISSIRTISATKRSATVVVTRGSRGIAGRKVVLRVAGKSYRGTTKKGGKVAIKVPRRGTVRITSIT